MLRLNYSFEYVVCAISFKIGDVTENAEVEAGRELIPYCTLAYLPISYIAGLFGYLIGSVYSAGLVIWLRRYKFDALLKYAKQYAITAFYIVPSIYLRLSKSPEVTDQFATVEGAATSAAPMDGELQAAANRKLGKKARETVYIGQTWGLSETTGAMTAQVKDADPDVTGSIAPLLPGVQMRVVDDDFNDVEEGKPREFVLKAPMVTQGYFNNPKVTEEIMTYVKEHLAPYKQLRGGVVFLKELSKSAIGKYLRRELRKRSKKQLGIQSKL
ncbi:hypothetical protein G7Y89_g4323 [Cudoniella acicularis]|uniref:AMP-dependent synthetase/ligase domain-containing protein n=1 Tax=Cudoniella acicularis TaxID=354080 RepID=A0A8H4RRU5_9HELO|nr:hypothetical protein G7Y89_g4323 [Cudoniella acicularis]